MSAGANRPIIVVRKKAGDHDDGHGGAWKVAYADFVTAMMALFIVLWLLSASEKVQKAVGGYFQDPTGKGRQTGTTNSGTGETLTLNRKDLQTLKEKIEEVLKQIPEFQHLEKQVRITLTTEGLRIDLIETERGLFFESGNPKPTEAGNALLKALTAELLTLPNKVAIEGHTDSKPYGGSEYSNWELSTDRANAARRILVQAGFPENRISQVRGFADQRLLKKSDPMDPSNRRVSIIVRNQGLDEQEEAAARAQPAPAGPGKPVTK
ncbi:MAG TPA: flagellar motor protein MotB [Bryobacteraceae bacterium]|nr:flagellar motor protein MotB [Bryobacteraceae bacterium]